MHLKFIFKEGDEAIVILWLFFKTLLRCIVDFQQVTHLIGGIPLIFKK